MLLRLLAIPLAAAATFLGVGCDTNDPLIACTRYHPPSTIVTDAAGASSTHASCCGVNEVYGQIFWQVEYYDHSLSSIRGFPCSQF